MPKPPVVLNNDQMKFGEQVQLSAEIPRPQIIQRRKKRRGKRDAVLTSTSVERHIDDVDGKRDERSDVSDISVNRTEHNLYVKDPCLPVNHFINVDVPEDMVVKWAVLLGEDANQPSAWKLVRKGIGRYDECLMAMRPLLNTNGTCTEPPCSMNGVHQPEMDMATIKLYGFSEYWYSMYDILGLGGYYDHKEFTRRAAEYCATKWSVIQDKFRHNLFPRADKPRLNTQCIKAAWIMLVLHEGFRVPITDNQFRSASKINEQEVQWTMGALLHKMRYFPLRELERQRLHEQKQTREQRRHQYSQLSYDQMLLIVVIFSLLLLLVRHLFRLHARRKSAKASSFVGSILPDRAKRRSNSESKLPRNRSIWGYMMTGTGTNEDELQLMQGVRVETSDYVY